MRAISRLSSAASASSAFRSAGMLSRAAPAGSRAASSASASAGGSLAGTVYQLIFKRNVTYVSYILGGAIVLEVVYGTVLDGVWKGVNKGVSACERVGFAGRAGRGGSLRGAVRAARRAAPYCAEDLSPPPSPCPTLPRPPSLTIRLVRAHDVL